MRWQDEADIRRLLQRQERRIGEFFRLAVDEYLGDLGMARVLDLLERGRIRDALDDFTKIANATANASQAAFLSGAEATAAYIQSTNRFSLGFDQTNARAVDLMARNKLNFVQGFDDGQRRATLAALQAGINDGFGPRKMARQFRGSIGLTEGQQRAVDNYRRLLGRVGAQDVPLALQREFSGRKLRDRRHDSRIQRAIRDAQPLSQTEINKMVERYRQNSIAHRALNIARTESLSNVHGGQDAALDDALANKAITRNEILQKWLTGQDGRQRDAHQELHGTSVPWGDPWINSIGPIYFPGDRSADAGNIINCRCARTIRIR